MSPNTKNRKIKIIIYLIINILIMLAIFGFSAQPASQSAAVSKGFLRKILRIIAAPVFSNDIKTEQFVLAADGIVRKCAHFSLYLIFGIFMFLLIREFDFKKIKPYLLSVPIVFLYAVSDEIHQYFIPGRSCEFRDMMIDLAGAVCGTIIIYMIKKRSLWK